jgi:hypothetical protein
VAGGRATTQVKAAADHGRYRTWPHMSSILHVEGSKKRKKPLASHFVRSWKTSK